MAISKILYIGDCGSGYAGKHLKQALDYIVEEHKTGEGKWISSLNCQVESAYEQMRQTKVQFGKTDQRQGYHMIISFVEGEVDAETAFEVIGKFVKEYLGQDYEAIYSVHDNTDYVHGHIIFNSVSFRTGKKYRYEKGDWASKIQPITNRLCEEYGLSTIEISDDRTRPSENYKEWNDFRDGKFVWADMIKRDIDACIMQAATYESFLAMLSDMGYEIKNAYQSEGKYLAIKPMLSKDDLNLAELGIGVNGDGETKTALFCVIPDSDKSYNFIIGMLYTQIFQELYYQADFNCGGRLPIHVTFMLDEFANVALPDDYCSLLSTMRSREISSIIIIQNFAQLKALFKDTWETIPGNCDTFIYLGGNEQSTHKYVSELLGKGTIDKKSSGETRGRQGSSSRNYDVLGRELFTPDEVRKLDNKKCLIFIRGFNPIVDNKYVPFGHPAFSQTADGKGKPYVHFPSGQKNTKEPPYKLLSPKAVSYYENLKEKGENVYIDTLTYEEFAVLTELDMKKRFLSFDEKEQCQRLNKEQGNELRYAPEALQNPEIEKKVEVKPKRQKIVGEDTIMNRMAQWQYSKEQKEELHKMMALGMAKSEILSIFYPETDVVKMREIRRMYQGVKKQT